MLRIVCFLSLATNVFFTAWIVYEKGGIHYLQVKLGIVQQTVPDHERHYFHKKSMHELLPVWEGAIVFIGNSLTENCPWNELFPGLKIQNRGIGGDWTDGIADRIDAIAQNRPSKIFFEIGLADLNDRPHDLDRIVENYRKIAGRVTALSPQTKMYFQSVLPVRDTICRYMRKKSEEIIALNSRLKQLAKVCKATYIDLFPSFVTADNQLIPDYTVDGGHLNGKGYLVWKSLIESSVKGP